jgi:hypothetical protein
MERKPACLDHRAWDRQVSPDNTWKLHNPASFAIGDGLHIGQATHIPTSYQ